MRLGIIPVTTLCLDALLTKSPIAICFLGFRVVAKSVNRFISSKSL